MKIDKNINKNIFREYDLRGVYPTDINMDTAYTIGLSFGSYIKEMGETATVIGRDNRLSGITLTNSLIYGIISTGIDVYDLGLVTTPMYYAYKKNNLMKTGIMVTASHNPKEYNGFKISFDHIGNAYGDAIKEFYKYTVQNNFQVGKGHIYKQSVRDYYLELIKDSINLGERKIKVVIDCGNGTGSVIVKEVMKMFENIDTTFLYCDSNPEFPNHHPDPAESKNMIDLGKKVVELKADFGIGIDGDADRVGIVDHTGKLIPVDKVMLIVYRALNDVLTHRNALFDVKCGMTLIDGLDALKINKTMYRTGASYTNMMVNTGDFDFGGEFSGHLFFKDKFKGFDDGIYAGLRIIEILSNTNGRLIDLLANTTNYFSTEEIKFKTTEDKKFQLVDKIKDYVIKKKYEFLDIDGVRVIFKDGWALIRASNTGPNLTLRFEAKTKERLNEIETEFKTYLETINNF